MEKLYFDEKRDKKSFYLIIYDIQDSKRRKKISTILEGYGARVQYSAFEAWITVEHYNVMLKRLLSVIVEEDNLRIYRLNPQNPVLFHTQIESENCRYDMVICSE